MMRHFFCAAVFGMAVFLSGCSQPRATAPYPHESVLSAVTELKLALKRDPYLYPPMRDLNGRNMFRVTLERLQSLERLTGEKYSDIIEFAQAECYERLGDWDRAARGYERVYLADTSLSDTARARSDACSRLHEISSEPGLESLEGYIDALDRKMEQLSAFYETAPEVPYAAFVKTEFENALRNKVGFLIANRFVVRDAIGRATSAADELVSDYWKSHRAGENRLLRARIYETLAHDYANVNSPHGDRFDLERWKGWVSKARDDLHEAARADGDPAKPEAQARLRALDAFSYRIGQSLK